MAQKAILLIDGSKASRAIISKTIKNQLENVKITDLETATAALVQCQNTDFDLIITAMSLPDMRAQEFAKKFRTLRNNKKSTPIIMMSGDFIQNIQNKTTSPYINGYFDKSQGNDRLVEYIRSYLFGKAIKFCPDCHILYVEDSPTVTRVVTSIFDNNGYSYKHVTNAADALVLLAKAQQSDNTEKPFDIMLTDIQLEGLMSGDDLIREVRFGLGLDPEQFPILVSTSANPDRNEQVRCLFGAGANDIIEKPIHENLLITRMNNLVRLKKKL
jgi:CheY-like chemotaxis protein